MERLSWPGVITSQVMCAVLIWGGRRLGFDPWWTMVIVAAAAGYAVAHLHPPYRQPLLRLAGIYAAWAVGGFAGRAVEQWVRALLP